MPYSASAFLPTGDRCGGRLPGVCQDNQPTLLNDIRLAFAPPAGGAFSPSAATNLGSRHGHGDDPRQGTRSSRASHVKATTAERVPGLAWCCTVGQVESDVVKTADHARNPLLHHQCFEAGGRATVLKARALSVENRSHYVRDVTMQTPADRKRSAEVMAPPNATIGCSTMA